MRLRVGDYVELVRDSNSLRKGEVYRVARVTGGGWVRISSTNALYNPSLFKLYKDNDEMSKFKVGDKVRKVLQKTYDFNIGDTAIVSEVLDVNTIKLNNTRDTYSSNCWELVEDNDKYPNGKHPHHDIILEYAKGAEIEFFSESAGKWMTALTPAFGKNTLYRVKPQQDPAVQAAKKKIEQAEQMLREANDELDRLGL